MNLKFKKQNEENRKKKIYFFNKLLKNLKVKNKFYFRYLLTIFTSIHFDRRNFKGVTPKH